ncbi:MAG: hypothetical protein WB562_17840 [Candidatus Sulfotelmatobacter sp.]
MNYDDVDAMKAIRYKEKLAMEHCQAFVESLKEEEFDDDSILFTCVYLIVKEMVRQGVAPFSFLRAIQEFYDNMLVETFQQLDGQVRDKAKLEFRNMPVHIKEKM